MKRSERPKPSLCEDCRHWHACFDLSGAGWCRCKPPVLTPPIGFEDRRTDVQRTRWPVTMAYESCGEFARRAATSASGESDDSPGEVSGG